MQAGLETFNQQPCSPESCHSVTLAKVLLFGKAAPFFAKKGHCSNLIFGVVNTLAFWTPKSGPPQLRWSLLLEQNPTLIYLRNVRASCFEQVARFHTAKNGIGTRYRFSLWTGQFRGCFQFLFNSRRDQKRAHQIHALERVVILLLGLRHDARNAPSCFKSSPENMKPQKAGRMTQTSTCWTGEDRLWESKFYIPFQPQKWASNKSNSSVTSSCACCGFLRSRLESQSWNSFNPFPHCKWGFSRCTDSARLRQDSAAKDIKTGTKLW